MYFQEKKSLTKYTTGNIAKKQFKTQLYNVTSTAKNSRKMNGKIYLFAFSRVLRDFLSHFSVSASGCLLVGLSVCPSICPFVRLSVHPSVGPSVHPSENCFKDIFNLLREFPTISSPLKHFCQSACSSFCLSVCLSSFL